MRGRSGKGEEEGRAGEEERRRIVGEEGQGREGRTREEEEEGEEDKGAPRQGEECDANTGQRRSEEMARPREPCNRTLGLRAYRRTSRWRTRGKLRRKQESFACRFHSPLSFPFVLSFQANERAAVLSFARYFPLASGRAARRTRRPRYRQGNAPFAFRTTTPSPPLDSSSDPAPPLAPTLGHPQPIPPFPSRSLPPIFCPRNPIFFFKPPSWKLGFVFLPG